MHCIAEFSTGPGRSWQYQFLLFNITNEKFENYQKNILGSDEPGSRLFRASSIDTSGLGLSDLISTGLAVGSKKVRKEEIGRIIEFERRHAC